MFATFRQSMTWLHTWCGLVFGWMLFAIFFAGTIAVYRHEVDHWMRPELHSQLPRDPVHTAQTFLQKHAPDAARWIIELPSSRSPSLRVRWQPAPRERLQSAYLDTDGQQITPRDTRGGTMIYRFHYGLLMGTTGMWIVGGLGMAMFIALITGIIIHAKIFKEFFTFRAFRAAPRAWLDAHTVSSVMVLPFSLMITYSGLVIWWFIWMPGGIDLTYRGDRTGFFRDMSPGGFKPVAATSTPASLIDLRTLAGHSRDDLDTELRIGSLTVISPGRSGSTVEASRISDRVLWGESDRLRFDATTGTRLDRIPESGPTAYTTYRIVRIIHEIKFADHWLRFLFFAMSAVSTAAIATGTLVWGVKRRSRHFSELQRAGTTRQGIVTAFGIDALNVGVIGGMFFATAAYLTSNRAIPVSAAGRADLEVTIFFTSWLIYGLLPLVILVSQPARITTLSQASWRIRQLWGLNWIGVSSAAFAVLASDVLSRTDWPSSSTTDTPNTMFMLAILLIAVVTAGTALRCMRQPESRKITAKHTGAPA